MGIADSYVRQFASAAAAWGKPFYLRFAWEMNNFGPWAVGQNGNTAADFVAMWQHVHDIFVQQGATNVRWYWCPNGVGDPRQASISSVYPGDNYVDVVGFDAYNWGTTQSWSSWGSLYSIYSPTYEELTALTNKPIIVGETASTEQGGSKAQWITQGFLTDLPAQFPRIIGLIWFDDGTDWDVNSSASSLAAYQQAAASPIYRGTLP